MTRFRFALFVIALVSLVLGCGRSTEPHTDASAALSAKLQLVEARLADVRAAVERRCAVIRNVVGANASCDAPPESSDHDLRVELEGAENRLLRARELYNAAVADYDAALSRGGANVVDSATGKRFEMRSYLPVSRAGGETAPFVVPKLEGRVTDLAGKLTTSERAAIENDLAAFDRATTNEIAVLVLPSLLGHSIEDAAYATANAWKLGKRGADNGVLLVIAVAERRVRIETGRGIGGALTDLRAQTRSSA